MSGPRCGRISAAGCFVLALLAPATARGDAIYIIRTNTSTLQSGSGFIDLQYNGLANAGASTATITGFSSDGSLGGCVPASACVIGDASGDLASTLVIENGALNNSGLNDYDEAITFGTFVEFTVVLSGPPGGTANSGFALIYYNSDYTVNLLSAELSGVSATLTIQPDGGVLASTYQADDGKYYTTITEGSEPSSVPEPSSALAIVAGLALLAGWTCRRRESRFRRTNAVPASSAAPTQTHRVVPDLRVC